MNYSNEESIVILVPGLPNELAELCLLKLDPALLSSVCRSWRRLIYSPSFPPFFSLYALLSPLSTHQPANSTQFFSLDPISSKWIPLPPPPPPPLHLLHRHPAFISRKLPIQSLTVSGHLVLIAATTHHFVPALPCPLLFDPLSKNWLFGPPFPTPRRWCATGVAQGAVYVASGIGSHYNSDVAQSMEKWDQKKRMTDWCWEKMAKLKDVKFSREAVEAIGYKGKLYMVNIKGNAWKEGALYDVSSNSWGPMPAGMLAGWNGPAAADGDEMYVVDEAMGGLRKYDSESDRWEAVIESMEDLKRAEQMAVGRGRVCIVCANGRRIAVVDVVARPVRVWMVDPPPAMEVVAVHILPRMSLP
ncbi:hypothetical protein LguiB_011131 [Lonicera macranthoides]